jgi:hypothetical protein
LAFQDEMATVKVEEFKGLAGKVCNHCKIKKPFSEFHRNARRYDNVSKRCKQCASAMAKQTCDKYREKFRAYSREWSKKRRKGLRELVWYYKAAHPCIDCGESDPSVLEFDHVTGEKIGDINGLVRTLRRESVILTEMAKCVMRCANCHRRRHWFETPRVCFLCGGTVLLCMVCTSKYRTPICTSNTCCDVIDEGYDGPRHPRPFMEEL